MDTMEKWIIVALLSLFAALCLPGCATITESYFFNKQTEEWEPVMKLEGKGSHEAKYREDGTMESFKMDNKATDNLGDTLRGGIQLKMKDTE